MKARFKTEMLSSTPARKRWPKENNETDNQKELRKTLRRAHVDPRVAVILRRELGRNPTKEEIEVVREFAYTAEKKLRRRSGKTHGRA